MKIRFYLTSFIMVSILFTSCERDKVEKLNILKGRLLIDCSGNPFANKSISLYQALSYGLTIKGGTVAETTTDNNGNFEFKYTNKNSELLRINSYGAIIANIPAGQDL